MSSLLIPPFQIACTYVSLSNIRVNAFGFHVACNHYSPICSSTTSAIQLQNLAGTSNSKSWTNLETLYQSPNKLTLWPKLTLQICTKLLSACFSSSKLWISKKYTLFHFLWKTTSFTHLTQFYIPSQNELIWKTPFFIFSILASGKTVRLWTIFSWTWIFLQIHPQQNE